MTDLILITSSDHGMPTAVARDNLEQVLNIVRRRANECAAAQQLHWTGPKTTLLIAPAGQMLARTDLAKMVEHLARVARKTGLRIRLVDSIAYPPPADWWSEFLHTMVQSHTHDVQGRPVIWRDVMDTDALHALIADNQ